MVAFWSSEKPIALFTQVILILPATLGYPHSHYFFHALAPYPGHFLRGAQGLQTFNGRPGDVDRVIAA